MNDQRDLVLIVTYAIVFLFIFLIAIIIFIVKSRSDRIKIEEKKKFTNRLGTSFTCHQKKKLF